MEFKATEKISARCTPELKERVQNAAVWTGSGEADFVRIAIEEFFASHPTPEEQIEIVKARQESKDQTPTAELPKTPAAIAQAVTELRAEFAAFCTQFRDVLSTKQRIEPDALYSVAEAATLVDVSAYTLRKKLRCGIIRGKGPRWQIRGSELLKLGGKTQ